MELRGSITNGRPLLVFATDSETQAIDTDLPVLVTGVGVLRAAIGLTEVLTEARLDGRVPSAIINLGTCGGLIDGPNGVYEVREVYKHDFSSELLEEIDGRPEINALTLHTSGLLPTARLATGDSFIADTVIRTRLAERAELVEMEGYCFARIGHRYGIPVTLLKQISDGANEESVGTWADAVAEGSRQLNDALHTLADAGALVQEVPVPVARS